MGGCYDVRQNAHCGSKNPRGGYKPEDHLPSNPSETPKGVLLTFRPQLYPIAKAMRRDSIMTGSKPEKPDSPPKHLVW
jgi:hypothetical protein